MKIIGGKYKGRKIEGYNIQGTRPTMDKVRESLFATIQDHIKEKVVLDLFAGTGALGFEALSWGASFCYMNDYHKKCTQTIQKTKQNLQIEKIDIKTMPYQKALSCYQKNKIQFDILFLDPPYAGHLISDCINEIKKKDLIKKKGLIICEYETEIIQSPYPIWKEKTYGKKKITIYKNI